MWCHPLDFDSGTTGRPRWVKTLVAFVAAVRDTLHCVRIRPLCFGTLGLDVEVFRATVELNAVREITKEKQMYDARENMAQTVKQIDSTNAYNANLFQDVLEARLALQP